MNDKQVMNQLKARDDDILKLKKAIIKLEQQIKKTMLSLARNGEQIRNIKSDVSHIAHKLKS